MIKKENGLQTILLIEDDKLTRHFIRAGLEDYGFIVIDAMSGKRAIEILHHHTIR